VRLILILFLLFLFLPVNIVKADTPDPNYVAAECPAGKTLVECNNGQGFEQYRATGHAGADECLKYENNPDYKELYTEGHGSTKYCYQPTNALGKIFYYIKYLGLLILITIILELPILRLFGFKTRKNVWQIIWINIITVTTLYIVTANIIYHDPRILIALELLVILVEAILYKWQNYQFSWKRVAFGSLTANAVSAIFGGAIFSLLIKIIT